MSASTPSSFFAGLGELPADNPMLSGLAMMRQVWGGNSPLAAGLPLSPTLDPKALASRIDELRTVENWLNLNLTLLRSTIQGLEVQRATIDTLQGFLGAMPAAGATAAEAPAAATEDPAVQAAQAWWSLLQQQFQGFAAAAAAATPGTVGEPAAAPVAPAAPDAAAAPAPKKRAAKTAAKTPRARAPKP